MQHVSAVVETPFAGLEALPDGACMLDATGRVTYCNPAAERLLGVPRASIVGRTLGETFPGVDAASLARGTQPNGSPLPPPWTGLIVRLAPAQNGVLLQLRHGREAAPSHYAGLLDSVRHGIVGVDAIGRVDYLNRAARAMLGVTRREALGADLWSVLPHEPPALRDGIRGAMRDGRATHLDTMQLDPEPFRGRWFDIWTHPLPDGGISILFEDVTGRIARDHDLARYAAEAEEGARAKGRFFAAASHELRTPLHAVVGYTHLLATNTFGPMPAEAERAAERANLCAEHLSSLVDDVLLLTTTEVDRLRMNPVRLHLDQFLPSVLEPLRRQAEAKGLRFEVSCSPALPSLRTDPDRLRQILQAVVGNAVKFTSRGSVTLQARARDEWMEVRVSDSGPGVPDEDRDRIFEPFEQLCDPARTDSMTRGTGLGLTIARKLSERLHGSLTSVGGEAGGAVFQLLLPLDFPEPD
jgi:two-component system, sensor histidine kinase